MEDIRVERARAAMADYDTADLAAMDAGDMAAWLGRFAVVLGNLLEHVDQVAARSTTPSDMVKDVCVGDVVRHERMAMGAGGGLTDCKVTKSYRTQLTMWAIEWHTVDDETVAGALVTRPDEPIKVISRA